MAAYSPVLTWLNNTKVNLLAHLTVKSSVAQGREFSPSLKPRKKCYDWVHMKERFTLQSFCLFKWVVYPLCIHLFRKKKNGRQLIESTSGAACTRVDWLTGMRGHTDKDTGGAWAVLPVCWGLTARCGRGESAINYWWWMLLVVMVVGWGWCGL